MTPWKLASTLILARASLRDIFNYRLLLLQRTATSSFFPNASVFPGGMIDPSDYSSELWIPILNKMRPRIECLNSRIRLPIYKEFDETYLKKERVSSNFFNGEIVFRLCALRETFEETGLLLVRDKEQNRLCIPSADLPASSQTNWQLHVKQNPHGFAELFHHLNMTPDITSLHEWASWLTPSIFPMKKRYDTVFYFAMLPADTNVTISRDKQESVGAMWKSPLDWLDSHRNSQVQLAPPQVYELGRLCQFTQCQMLERYAEQRASVGSERWTPIVYYSEDESLRMMVYPGDERYPADGVEMSPPIKMSREELVSWIDNDSHRNRLLKRGPQWYDGESPFLYDVNVDRMGHVQPISVMELNSLRSKHSS